jgi:hypothetical protein
MMKARILSTMAMGLCACVWASSAVAQSPLPLRLDTHGVRLPGPQFHYDGGFDVVDWNQDGLPDLYMHEPGSNGRGGIYLNLGTPEHPRFSHDIFEPYNNTETGPQAIEHTVARAYADLTGDDRRDAIFYDGQLRLAPNLGSEQSPFFWSLWTEHPQFFPGSDKMLRENARYVTGPESMFWKLGIFPRQVVTFTFADWNGNGLLDLIICRFEAEAPGVEASGLAETWGAWGRHLAQPPKELGATDAASNHAGPLQQAPARGTYLYLNTGTATQPFYDEGVALTTADGTPIVAPNPVMFDVDGDGVMDLVTTEAPYRSNSFRVDWPTQPHVMWFRRTGDVTAPVLEAGQPVTDLSGKPIPAGVMARFADMSGQGRGDDLLVLDGEDRGSIRWYRNTQPRGHAPSFAAEPTTLRGRDFARMDFSVQPLIVDWFARDSRDLILHGVSDHHCKFGLRRTALYRNVATAPGDIAYEFAGWVNYNGDPAMVSPTYEERPYEVFASAMSVAVDHNSGQRRIAMSVGGKLFYFTELAADGLTFRKMQRLDIPFESNRMTGWQDVDVNVPFPVKHIRLGNDRNGMGNMRDSFLHVLQLQAMDESGANVLDIQTHPGVKVDKIHTEEVPWYQVQRPLNMLTPGNVNTDAELKATTFGYFIEDAQIELEKAATLKQIRIQFSDRDELAYKFFTPFRWMGQIHRMGHEADDLWFHYELKVSADGKEWVTVSDRVRNEMFYSFPVLIDWNGDGKLDLLLGYATSKGIYPQQKRYRLYPNIGSNEEPRYGEPIQVVNAEGNPLAEQAAWAMNYANQSGVAAVDLDGDGKRDLIFEGHQQGVLYVVRNISDDANTQMRFDRPQWPQEVQAGPPSTKFTYVQRNRYFTVADVDGDGVLDLLNSDSDNGIILFRGISAAAPPAVTDLAVAPGAADELMVTLTRPQGASGYAIRWSDGDEVNALNWQTLTTGVEGTFNVEPGQVQQVALSGIPSGRWVSLAARTTAADAHSPLSNVVRAATPPLYQERVAPVAVVTLDAALPDQATPADAALLEVRAQTGTWGGKPQHNQKVIVLQFNGLPDASLERAELVMHAHADQQLAALPLQPPMTNLVSVNVLDADWDPTTATWAAPRPGQTWPDTLLESGGQFHGFAHPVFMVTAATTLRWDVTAAVRDAQQQGRERLDLLVRVDYTGHYVSNVGFKLCGPGWKDAAQRPSLILTTKRP